MKTLLLTDSYDATSDVIIHYVGSDNIFRLNIDMLQKTQIHIYKNKLVLKNDYQEVHSDEISKVLWRKPFNYNLDMDNYLSSEIKYIFREIFNFFSLYDKTILVLPNVVQYVGKIVQMEIAAKYFNVPKWDVAINYKMPSGEAVAKSLSSEMTNEHKVIYTTRVEKEQLNPQYPWFVQNLVNATHDITMVYVNGVIFSYELIRKDGLVDWRKEINLNQQTWDGHILPNKIITLIDLFMRKISLKFGRLDFLFDGKEYYFLEVNPNGQWAWLDLENKNGLMKEMVKQISPNNKNLALVKGFI